MSSSALNQGVLSAKISNIQNAADSSTVYSGGVWSFKNSSAVTSVTIDNSGNVGVGTASPGARLESKVTRTSGTNTTALILSDDVIGAQTNGFGTQIRGVSNNGSAVSAIGFEASGGSNNDTGISFYTQSSAGNLTRRALIDASGNLLVGKTSASDTAGAGVYVTPAGGIYSTQTGSINYLTCYNTTASAYRFYVTAAGQINATSTSIAAISDASLKENVRDLETGLSQVLALKPRRFDWKEETQIDQKDVAGFIAQEVEEILPELVYEYKYNETETKKSLKMGDMLPTLVKAIQELSAKVDAQAAEIEALKAK